MRLTRSFSAPFVKEKVVPVLALGDGPLVERLGHDHETDFVAQLHLPRCRYVMGRANGVAPHLLHDEQLPAQRGLVDGRTQRAEVVMQTHPLELAGHSVEKESFLGQIFNRTHPETGGIFVEQLSVFTYRDNRRIEFGRLGRPQPGALYRQPGCRRTVEEKAPEPRSAPPDCP